MNPQSGSRRPNAATRPLETHRFGAITVGETVGIALSEWAKYWSEWQDLAFWSFAIEITYVFECDFRFCVPRLCTLGKRGSRNVQAFIERKL